MHLYLNLFVHHIFFIKDHVEGYLELSGKTKSYFATAVSLWDADFYIKVDDDVHVNIGRYFYCIFMELVLSYDTTLEIKF